jgi:hypothetical protein
VVANADQYGATRNMQVRASDVGGSLYAITGFYDDTGDFGLGPITNANDNDNAFIAAFDVASRTARYSFSFNGAGDVYGNGIALGRDGSMCITGRFGVTTDFGAGPTTPQSNDAYVARFDPQGNFLWARTTNGVSSEVGKYVRVLDNGDCVTAGTHTSAFTLGGKTAAFTGMQDFYVARLAAADGAAQWLITGTGAGYDDLVGLGSYGSDRIAVFVTYEQTAHVFDRDLTSMGGADGALVVLDGAGNVVLVDTVGGAGSFDTGGGISFDPSGRHLAASFVYKGDLTVPSLGFAATASGVEAGGVLVVTAP